MPFEIWQKFAITASVAMSVFFVLLLLKVFVLSEKWRLTELMVVVALSGFNLGYAFKYMSLLIPVQDIAIVYLLAPYGMMAILPVVIGGWWGLGVARRGNEQRAAYRIGLMLLGYGYMIGMVAIPIAFIFTGQFFYGYREAARFAVIAWLVVGLITPARAIERAYKIVHPKNRSRYQLPPTSKE